MSTSAAAIAAICSATHSVTAASNENHVSGVNSTTLACGGFRLTRGTFS